VHNEELHSLYSSPNIIKVMKSKRMRQRGNVTCKREMRNVYKILVGKPEGKRPLRRYRHRQEDNTGYSEKHAAVLMYCIFVTF